MAGRVGRTCPFGRVSVYPRTGRAGRHPVAGETRGGPSKVAHARAGIAKPATHCALRYPFATHLLGAAYGIRTVQALPGPWEVAATQIHTHALGGGTGGLPSPLDRLPGAVKPI